MSVEKRDRPHARHRSPSMSELLASCAAADAVSRPPERPGAASAASPSECAAADTAAAAGSETRRDAA